MDHSKISPSSMARISACPASVSMQERVPEDDRPHEIRDIGTAVHWCNEQDLRGKPVAPGAVCPENGIVITQEMLNRGKVYVDYCRPLTVHNHGIEDRVECKRIHDICFGTVDFWAYDPTHNHLTVVDYKDGFIDVDPTENAQGIVYASGLINRVDNNGLNGLEHMMTIDIVIIQPRSGGIKTWSTTVVELRPFINMYSGAAHEALSDLPKAKAGEHCKYCRARAVCKSLGTTVQNLVHTADNSPVEPDLAQEYEFLTYGLKLLQARLTAIEAECLQNPPTGYEVGTGRGRKNWNVDIGQIQATGMLYGVDLMKDPAPITPTQAINMGMPKDVIDNLSVYTPGKPTLKRVDMNELSAAFAAKEN